MEAKLRCEEKARSELETTRWKLEDQKSALNISLDREKALHKQADMFVARLQAKYQEHSHSHEETLREHRRTLKMLQDTEAEKDDIHSVPFHCALFGIVIDWKLAL